jgi:hypothetical protein
MASHAERVQEAYTAATGGVIEPLVALFDPDFDWEGVEHGLLWWRHLSYVDVSAEVVDGRGPKVVVNLRWHVADDPEEHELYEVLTLRQGKITELDEYEARGEALAALL